MNLPPLPPVLCHTCDADEQYTADQMREYGALCRRMALEEAAKLVDHIMFFNGQTFGEKIREPLK